jgi:glycerol uptake facilitator-like aquaporin
MAEDFQNPNEKRLHFWEYVFIITLGPVLAAINLALLVRERWQQRKQRG